MTKISNPRNERSSLLLGLTLILMESAATSIIFYISNKDGGYWKLILFQLLFINLIYFVLQNLIVSNRKINPTLIMIHSFFLTVSLFVAHNFYFLFGNLDVSEYKFAGFNVINIVQKGFFPFFVYGVFLAIFIFMRKKD